MATELRNFLQHSYEELEDLNLHGVGLDTGPGLLPHHVPYFFGRSVDDEIKAASPPCSKAA